MYLPGSIKRFWWHLPRPEVHSGRVVARWRPNLHPTRSQHTTTAGESHLPRIVQPSMWELIIPPVVRQKTKELIRASPDKRSNPASYFIWIYLFIGSQAIRILGVKNEYVTFERKADLQIEKLREVIKKLQAGEAVDVEKILGTGVPEEEEAWVEALREIEGEEKAWQTNKQREEKERLSQQESRARQDAEAQDASPVSNAFAIVEEFQPKAPSTPLANSDISSPPLSRPGFY